jgi:hypothetical protein
LRGVGRDSFPIAPEHKVALTAISILLPVLFKRGSTAIDRQKTAHAGVMA